MALNIDSTTLAADASEEARQLRVYVQKAAQAALDAAESGNKDEQDPSGSLIYLGNPQTAVPDRLLTCADLDNDQKILWCLMRMQVQHPSKPAATPRRSDLADMLKVSRVTLITKIVGLRIYRWLTRCATIKSTNSTLNHGVVEAIHDQPLPLSDTLYLDPDYITWLESLAQNHSDNYKQIRATARKMLNNIDTEISKPAQDGQADRFYGFCSEDPDTPGVQKLNPDKNTNLPGSIIEPGEISPNTPGSKIEPGKNHQNHPG
ncbi:MAG TPA: hypothetical protein EYP41_03935, partial [Anaerolineae bacterium]|nr:hypothetical protein [Anaerolineae bacterium]